MEQAKLVVEERPKEERKSAKAIRLAGRVPAVVYHKGDVTKAVTLGDKDLHRVLHTEAGRNVLIDLKIKNEKNAKPRTVVVKEIQYHPVSGNALHVDFHQISLTEKIRMVIPVVEKGESVGVKTEDGVLEFPLREVEVECLPTEIPEHIEVDITNLHMNDAIFVKDLPLPSAVNILNDPEMLVVKIAPPHVEKEPEEALEEAAEPEVIGEKKEEEEGEEAKEEKPAEEKPAKEKPAEGA